MANFEINITGTNSPVAPGEDLEVEYEVTNTGSTSGTKNVELQLSNQDGEDVIVIDDFSSGVNTEWTNDSAWATVQDGDARASAAAYRTTSDSALGAGPFTYQYGFKPGDYWIDVAVKSINGDDRFQFGFNGNDSMFGSFTQGNAVLIDWVNNQVKLQRWENGNWTDINTESVTLPTDEYIRMIGLRTPDNYVNFDIHNAAGDYLTTVSTTLNAEYSNYWCLNTFTNDNSFRIGHVLFREYQTFTRDSYDTAFQDDSGGGGADPATLTTPFAGMWYSAWNSDQVPPSDVATQYLDMVSVAAVEPLSDGTVNLSSNLDSALSQFNNTTTDTVVIANIGSAAVDISQVESAIETDAKRQTLIDALINDVIRAYNIEGVELNFEWIAGDGGEGHGPNDPAPTERINNYEQFIIDLRSALDTAGDEDGATYYLGTSEGPDPFQSHRLPLATIGQNVDYCGFQGYPITGPWATGVTDHYNPLYHPDDSTYIGNPSDWPYANSVNHAVQEFLNAGFPAEKLVLGMYAWNQGYTQVPAGSQNDGYNQDYTDTFNQSFRDTVDQVENDAGWTTFYDSDQEVPYAYNSDTQDWISYDNSDSVNVKANYLYDQGGMGVMAWEYPFDTSSLRILGELRNVTDGQTQ